MKEQAVYQERTLHYITLHSFTKMLPFTQLIKICTFEAVFSSFMQIYSTCIKQGYSTNKKRNSRSKTHLNSKDQCKSRTFISWYHRYVWLDKSLKKCIPFSLVLIVRHVQSQQGVPYWIFHWTFLDLVLSLHFMIFGFGAELHAARLCTGMRLQLPVEFADFLFLTVKLCSVNFCSIASTPFRTGSEHVITSHSQWS